MGTRTTKSPWLERGFTHEGVAPLLKGENTPKIGSSIAQDSGKKSALPKGGGIINPTVTIH